MYVTRVTRYALQVLSKLGYDAEPSKLQLIIRRCSARCYTPSRTLNSEPQLILRAG